MSRRWQYLESRGLTGPVNAAIGNKPYLFFTGQSGDTWDWLSNCSVNMDSTDADVTVQNALGRLDDRYIKAANVLDYYHCPMFGTGLALGAPPNNFLRRNVLAPDTSGGPETISMRESAILALLHDPTDVIFNGIGDGYATASTSFTPLATLDELPAGTYLVMAFAQVYKDTTASSSGIRLTIDGTSYSTATIRGTSATAGKGFPWSAMQVVTVAAGNVITVDGMVVTSGTMTALQLTIVAWDLSTFPAYYTATDATLHTTTSTSYQNGVALVQQPSTTAPHLILSCAMLTHSSTGAAGHITTYDAGGGAVTINEGRNAAVVAGAHSTHFSLQVVSLSSAIEYTFLTQWKRASGFGTQHADISDNTIVVIQLPPLPIVNFKGGNFLGGLMN